MFPGLHWDIRRDAFQLALPDPALRPIGITFGRLRTNVVLPAAATVAPLRRGRCESQLHFSDVSMSFDTIGRLAVGVKAGAACGLSFLDRAVTGLDRRSHVLGSFVLARRVTLSHG